MSFFWTVFIVVFLWGCLGGMGVWSLVTLPGFDPDEDDSVGFLFILSVIAAPLFGPAMMAFYLSWRISSDGRHYHEMKQAEHERELFEVQNDIVGSDLLEEDFQGIDSQQEEDLNKKAMAIIEESDKRLALIRQGKVEPKVIREEDVGGYAATVRIIDKLTGRPYDERVEELMDNE